MVIKPKYISKVEVAEHAQCSARVGGSDCKRVCRGSSSRLAAPSIVQSRREVTTPHRTHAVNKRRQLLAGLALHDPRHVCHREALSPSKAVGTVVPYATTIPGLTLRSDVAVTSEPVRCESSAEAQDVIDLGAPRRLRRAPAEPLRPTRRHAAPEYTPNPRLYPGKRLKPRKASEKDEQRGRRSKRVFNRPVPNARLYRPVAPRVAPLPPARPLNTWPSPEHSARTLDTASHVALRFAEQRYVRAPDHLTTTSVPKTKSSKKSARDSPNQRSPQRSRRLVVTLPAAAAGDCPPRYQPASEHFKLRDLDTASGVSTPPAARPRSHTTFNMDTANRHSTSPEDCSDGNETLSAPSEFLAEFLSAIMGRQYAEALKYCQLILQYEPHNATARGFFPLLQHKVLTKAEPGREDVPRDSSSESARSRRKPRAAKAPPTNNVMEQEADESPSEYSRTRSHSSGSCGSQSSLELDSSEPLQQSSGSHSLSISRKTDHTESGASGGSGRSGVSGISGARCSSANTDTDDNGNAPNTAAAASLQPDDLENDNATASSEPLHHLKGESSSLRRLRAQFACSIK